MTEEFIFVRKRMRGIGISTVKARSRSWLVGAQSGTMCFFRAGWTDVVEYNVQQSLVLWRRHANSYYTIQNVEYFWRGSCCCFVVFYIWKNKSQHHIYTNGTFVLVLISSGGLYTTTTWTVLRLCSGFPFMFCYNYYIGAVGAKTYDRAMEETKCQTDRWEYGMQSL